MSSKLLGAIGCMALLAGCETVPPQAGSLDAGFGEVTKYNAAVQTINPDPVYTAGGAQPGDHGEKGAAAVKRYRTDAVKDVEQIETGGRSGGGGPQ